MSIQDRRSSIININDWLDGCPEDEPDSMIYDPDYCNDVANCGMEQVKPKIEATYRKLTDICTKIGLTQQLIDERFNDVYLCHETFLNTLNQEFQNEFDKLCSYKDELLSQVQKMLKDLYLPEYQPMDNITLLQHCKRLKTKFNELNVVKQARMTRLNELRAKQTKHCLVLGIEQPPINSKTDIPTEEELCSLASTVMEMEKEEARRRAKYLKLKSDINNLIAELEYEPSTEFEQTVLTTEPNFSEKYLLEMTNFNNKLQKKHQEAMEKFLKLKEKLMSLYERLDTPEEDRDLFLSTHSICNPTTILELEIEIEHYEKLKKQNIGKFVEKIKDEIILEYEKCFYSQEDQDKFFSIFPDSGDYTEELLLLCEQELDRVKRYYEDYREILDKFQKWRMMWKELIDIELKANDPNRFTNRGGQLLLEEKKRKTLQKGLPRIEKELTTLNERYAEKSENNEKFKVFGTNLDEFISGCWDELNNAKEQEKLERQKAKMSTDKNVKKPIQNQAMTRRTPSKRAAGAGITPTPSKLHCQRPVLGTPVNSNLRFNQQPGSVIKSAQKSIYSSNNNLAYQSKLTASGRSNIPVSKTLGSNNNNGLASQRDKKQAALTLSNSNGSSLTSGLSLSEQEFESIISSCPASAKKGR